MGRFKRITCKCNPVIIIIIHICLVTWGFFVTRKKKTKFSYTSSHKEKIFYYYESHLFICSLLYYSSLHFYSLSLSILFFHLFPFLFLSLHFYSMAQVTLYTLSLLFSILHFSILKYSGSSMSLSHPSTQL